MKKFDGAPSPREQRAELEDFEKRLPGMSVPAAKAEFDRMITRGNVLAFQKFQQFLHTQSTPVKGMNWERLDGEEVELYGGGNIQDWPGLPKEQEPIIPPRRK